MAAPAHVMSTTLSTLDLSNHITYQDVYRRPVASGGYSDIYRAEVNGVAVAVKVMRDIDVQSEARKASLARVRLYFNLFRSLAERQTRPSNAR